MRGLTTMNLYLFLGILGLGVAIPFTLLILINVGIKMKAGENYQINIATMGKVYFVALLGWALFISIIIGG